MRGCSVRLRVGGWGVIQQCCYPEANILPACQPIALHPDPALHPYTLPACQPIDLHPNPALQPILSLCSTHARTHTRTPAPATATHPPVPATPPCFQVSPLPPPAWLCPRTAAPLHLLLPPTPLYLLPPRAFRPALCPHQPGCVPRRTHPGMWV